MIFMFFACFVSNLNGDSVHPFDPQENPADPPDGGVQEPAEPTLEGMSFVDATPVTQDTIIESELDVDVHEDGWDITHRNVALHCDMSRYETEMSIDHVHMIVKYMPMDEERDCFYDVSFSINYQFEPGEYTLTIMEDSVDIVVE